MKSLNYLSILAIATLASFTLKNNAEKVTDYFTLAGPIVFSTVPYSLAWSAHPTANYFKQEYLPAGEKSASFTHMISMEAVTGEVSLPDAVKAKMNELEQRKKTDPLANYQVIQNPKSGEYLLDFIMSQSGGNTPAVAEWNAYRYLPLANAAGKNGILLLAYSRRSYGNAIQGFLQQLKKDRQRDINLLIDSKLPVIKIKTN